MNESSDDNDVMSVEQSTRLGEEKSNSNNAKRNIPKKTKVDRTDRKEKAHLKGIYSIYLALIRVILSLLIRLRPRKERQTEKDY